MKTKDDLLLLLQQRRLQNGGLDVKELKDTFIDFRKIIEV